MKLLFAAVLVAISGFISLSYEILWFRVFAFTTGGAAIAFSALLGAYLLGIALGSLISGRFCNEDGAFSPKQLQVVALFILLGNLAGFLSIPWIASLIVDGAVINILTVHASPFVPVVFVAALLGAQFPLISHYGIEPDDLAGARLSYLYLSNIIGAVFGSLLTGFVLLDHYSMAQTAVILTCLGVVLAVALYVSARPTRSQQAAAVVVGLGTIIGVGTSSESLYHHIYEKLQWSTAYNDHESFKHIIENKSGVITVNEDDQIYGGGLYDGKFSTDLIDDMNMIGRAYSLSLFHPAPRQMLMIGLSSGSWAAVLANHPQLEKLTIIEINPGYLGLIEQYPEQTQILSDPRVEIIIDDGRRFLNRTDETYDAIIINTTYNWRSQISNLLSVEFNELIQAHLKPGGLYQFNTTGSAESIQAAFEVFPAVAGVLNHVIVSDAPFDVNKARWESMLRSYEIYGEPVFDLSLTEHQEHLDWLLAQAELLYTEPPPGWAYAVGWEYFLPQSYMSLAAGDAVPITDDNMGTEWPDPEIEWFTAD